ncbi:protein ANTAGONIST OF LIKE HETEROCHROMATIN PROTEIN 1 [Nasonia vitripennis]|uniref:DDE Tnp4 domain-containing protein n=1 Tax=Nasonia vitripennis TaxID=7425 RepID=A0A7M7GDU7_NASVI|nr:protein ANTAGONIST OF LIKE HETEROCHROMATIN PROTEIN 1 [Nasonia vitripennis]
MNHHAENVVILDFIFTSSSSSDDSDDEMNGVNNVIFEVDNDRIERRIPRVQNFIENVILRYNDIEFKETFRMSRTTFEYLLLLIRPNLEGLNEFGNMPINPDKQLYITLYVLGTPDSYRSVTTKFNVGKATAWRAVRRVVRSICQYRNYFIRWPSAREAAETSMRIARRRRLHGVIGAVDGTHIRIAALRVDSQAYINRKGVHSIQLQVICNDKLEFIHCYAGLPGSVHDTRVFRYSGVQQRCTDEYFPNNTHLLGDSAYTLQNHVIVPYRDNGHLTVEEVHFNHVLSGTRMMVERSIGLLKVRWRYFLDKLPMRRTDLIPYYIVCACVLHNICLKVEDTFEYPVIIPDTIDVNPEPMDVNIAEHQDAIAKRENLTNIVNADIL